SGACAVAGGHDSLRNRLREGSVNDVDDALARLKPAIDRGGMAAVEERSGRCRNRQRPRDSGIRRNLRIDDRLDGVQDACEERLVSDVQAAADLRGTLQM